jgi:hypothetical protein
MPSSLFHADNGSLSVTDRHGRPLRRAYLVSQRNSSGNRRVVRVKNAFGGFEHEHPGHAERRDLFRWRNTYEKRSERRLRASEEEEQDLLLLDEREDELCIDDDLDLDDTNLE